MLNHCPLRYSEIPDSAQICDFISVHYSNSLVRSSAHTTLPKVSYAKYATVAPKFELLIFFRFTSGNPCAAHQGSTRTTRSLYGSKMSLVPVWGLNFDVHSECLLTFHPVVRGTQWNLSILLSSSRLSCTACPRHIVSINIAPILT